MFDQSYGLRFDIYERIILSEDLPGIEELEEVELIPHIQVISQEEQATLRGHLLLAGLYKGDSEAGESEPLEHWIPVEITVPLNRVSSLDDIAVEIENFDVDLLSTRSLNITGVLSLKGIQAAVQGTTDRVWNNEEITVVHAPESADEATGYDVTAREQAEFQAANPSAFHFPQIQEGYAHNSQATGYNANPPVNERYEEIQAEQYTQEAASGYPTGYGSSSESADYYNADGAAGHELHRDQASQEYAAVQPVDEPFSFPEGTPEVQSSPESSNPNVWNFERNEKADYADQDSSGRISGIHEEREEDTAPTPTSAVQDEKEDEEELYEEKEDISAAEETVLLSEETSIPEEPPAKPELKVAFSTKNSTVDNPSGSGVGFSSLLQSSRTVQEQEIAAREEVEVTADAPEQLAVEEVQWKSLFLGSRQEETPFRKVRLCIVQREETLEAIAERYQLSPRELLLYNRLSEQSVEEGQVLYIP